MSSSYSGLNVIKASAGSGKTYTLAKNYIEHVLFVPGKGGKLELRRAKDYHQHILAITFTNKATQEMKTRIVNEMFTLSLDPAKSDYYDDFKKECSQDALDGLKDAASQALNALLFNYSAFKVSTIDSFFQSVLRNFARELDRDYNYDIELNDKYAVRLATQSFLSSLGKERQLTGGKITQVEKWVKEFQSIQLDAKAKWNSLYDLDGSQYGPPTLATFAADNINKEFVRKHLDDLCDYLSGNKVGENLEKIMTFRDILNNAAKSNLKKFETTSWQNEVKKILGVVPDDHFKHNKPFYKLYTYGTDYDSDSLKRMIADPTDPFKNGYKPTDTVMLGKLSAKVKEIIESKYYHKLFDALTRHLCFVGLLGEINKKLDEYRRDNNTLLIADSNELISKVISTHEDAPFIYERTGTWINTYMLDEFQDTSETQYGNFLPLLKESLSHSQDNFNLIIGDVKQAIYRFRNADPSLFRDRIDKDFTHIHPDTLRHNWRSLKNIIDFNNSFIEKLLALQLYDGCSALKRSYMPDGKDEYYKQLVPSKRETGEQGMVKVLFKDNNGKQLNALDDVNDFIIDYLLELHERFDWKDIIILVNRNKEGQSIVETVLDHNKKVHAQEPGKVIPIVSGEMMKLHRSTAVRRLINMLRFIDLTDYVFNAEDDELDNTKIDTDVTARTQRKRLAEQRKFVALGKFIEQIEVQGTSTSEQAGDVLNQCFEDINAQASLPTDKQLEQYALMLNDMLPSRQSGMMSLVSIVEHLIHSYVNNTESSEESIYLHAFQNCVIQFANQSNGGTVREFLRYWDRNKDNINVPDSGDVNAVNVLTIHKSKGLEAHCVIVPYAGWSNDASNSDLWVTREEWLNDGGRQLLDIAAGKDKWSKDIVPPILLMPRTALKVGGDEFGLFTKITVREGENDIIDNINRTYVAFTRPRKELHIFAVKLPKSGKNSIANQLEAIVPGMKGMELIGDGQYQMGKPWVRENDSNTSTKDNEVKWTNKELDSYAVSTNQVMVNLPSDINDMRETGKRLHALLSLITTRSDIDKAVRLCVRRGIITNDPNDPWNAAVARERLTALLNREDVKEWFDDGNKVYNERPLIVENYNHDFETKRPDRVIQRPDGSWVVIDYKFGQRNDEKHFKQVRPYIFALNKATGKYVTGYIWYLTLDTIVPV